MNPTRIQLALIRAYRTNVVEATTNLGSGWRLAGPT